MVSSTATAGTGGSSPAAMTTMTTAADGSSENDSPSDEPTASASTETDKVVVSSSLDGVVAEETELSPPATLPGPGYIPPRCREEEEEDEEEEEKKKEEEDVRTRRAAFATAQTPRHCNKKNRGGGGGGSNDNQDMDYAPEDDDDGDDGDDDRHPRPSSDGVSPHPIAAAGGDEASPSHGKSTRHPRPSTTSTAATAADHWDNHQQHQYLHPQRTNSQDGMSHECSGTRSGSMDQTLSSSSMSRSTHYGRPPPSYYHPARPHPSGVSFHDGGYHHHYSQYYEDPYDDDFGADPYSSSFSAPINGNHQDRHHHLHPQAVALNDPRRYDPQQLRTVVDTTRHLHPDHRHPPVHHRPHVVYRGGASAVREHLPGPFHHHYRPHPPPPGHPRTQGSMDDPRYSPHGSATNDYDRGHDDSHFASRHHRANYPYAPRGGGIYDYAYHRYEGGVTLSPPPPLSSSQRHQDRYHFDGGSPPSASKGEAVPSLLLPGPRGGGGAGHHRAVIVSGERRLLQRPPPQRQMGREGETAPPSRSPSGGGWQHSNRRHPLSSSGGVIDSGTMTTDINADQGGVDDVERGDGGSTTSVQGTASSSIGASIHAVSSSFSNEGNRQTKQTLGGVDLKGGGGRGGPLPEYQVATKQSPRVVTSSGSFGASIKTITSIHQEASLLLPNQPSLKSIEDDSQSLRSDSSWRQLQQIASVDKQEMMRMQSSSKSVSTYASECKETGNSPVMDAEVSAAAAGKGEMEVVVAAPMEKVTADAAVPADHGTVDTTDVTTTPSVEDDDSGCGVAANKRASPGELQTALSRTSSLSNSPTDDDHHNVALRHSSTGNDDAAVVAVHENREYAPPPPQSIDQYRMMQHPSHTPPT
ncbi:hypothetical protein ACHAW5_003278 [Stephanodiscus triporus]|uniref:Uncharacterized protein n=1 Tax=Stephanodiscus triporus TaxID=2934178 RepID=A0ABD3NF50_9STRA